MRCCAGDAASTVASSRALSTYLHVYGPGHGTNHLAAIATREPLNLYQSSHNRNQKGEALGNYLVPTDAGMEHIQKRLSKRGNGRGYHANMVPVRTCAAAC